MHSSIDAAIASHSNYRPLSFKQKAGYAAAAVVVLPLLAIGSDYLSGGSLSMELRCSSGQRQMFGKVDQECVDYYLSQRR